MTQDNSDDLDAARDFREQQQARFKQRRDEFVRVGRDRAKQLVAHLETFLPKSADVSAAFEKSMVGSPSAGPLDEPSTHTLVEKLCQDIEAAATKLGMPLHAGVSASSIMKDGLEAMQQRVMMTNASVVMVTPSLLLLCNRAAKLIARSLVVTSTGGQVEVSHRIDDFRTMLREDADLLEDWMRMFYDCARDLENPHPGRIYGVSGDRFYIWCLVREAMELFAVGHEYGHHIAQHSLNGEISSSGEERASQHAKEMEADVLGAVLASHAGADGKVPNAYAASGAGAVTLLTVLEFSRRAHHILMKGEEPEVTRNTHPPLDVRLETIRAAIDSVAPIDEQQHFLTLQSCMVEILDVVWEQARKAVRMMHDQGVRPVVHDPGWLPN